MPRTWSDALIAWLHDPPDKALSIVDHVSRARRYAEIALDRAIGGTELQVAADVLASATERLPMPDGAAFFLSAFPTTCRARAGISDLSTNRRPLRRSRPDRRRARAPSTLSSVAHVPRRSGKPLTRYARGATWFACAVWPHAPAAHRGRRAALTKSFSWRRRWEDCRSGTLWFRRYCIISPAGDSLAGDEAFSVARLRFICRRHSRNATGGVFVVRLTLRIFWHLASQFRHCLRAGVQNA